MLSLTESNRPPASAGTDGDYLRAVFAASPVAIVALDRSGVVTLWNPAAAAAFGWSTAEALGRSAPAEFVALCKGALDGETLTAVDVSLRAKNNAELAMRVSIAPLRDARAQVHGVVAFFAR